MPVEHPDVASWLLQALSVYGDAGFERLCQPGVLVVLLCAESLTALSTDIGTITRPPAVLQFLRLRHLEVDVPSWKACWLEGFFYDVNCSRSLESLKIVCDLAKEPYTMHESLQLPSMQLRNMPRLKHVRLDNCSPVHDLSLPNDCALFLNVVCGAVVKWHEHAEKFQRHTKILRLGLTLSAMMWDYAVWPVATQEFTSLRYLELDLRGIQCQQLADLRQIPHVKVIADEYAKFQLASGTWQTFEIFQFGKLQVDIADVDNFVRHTSSFTFMSESQPGAPGTLMQKIGDACQRQHKTCHIAMHCKKQCGRRGAPEGDWVHYVLMSTSKEMAENFPVIFNYNCYRNYDPRVSFGRGKTLADGETFWPPDPCASVKRA